MCLNKKKTNKRTKKTTKQQNKEFELWFEFNFMFMVKNDHNVVICFIWKKNNKKADDPWFGK